MGNYTITNVYITLTSIILLQSEIISVCLCLIKITKNLSLLGSSEYSSSNCFLRCNKIDLKSEINHLNRVEIFHVSIRYMKI